MRSGALTRGRAWTVGAGLAVAVVLALIAIHGSALGRGQVRVRATRTSAPAHASGQRGLAAKLTYVETDHGSQRGSSTSGIEGHGAFSAKLGATAASISALASVATGVPLTKLAQGGSYKVARQIAGNGTVTGTAVASFRAHGLGTVCVSYTEKPGKYVPGASFVPMSGTIKTLGGTGKGATWRVDVGFKQASVSGSRVERFGATGSEHAGTGKSRPLSAACKRVAALRP